MKTVKLHIGCGPNKMKGYIGLDSDKAKGVDEIIKDGVPWDIDNDSVDEVLVTHFINRCPDLIFFMKELYRVMKKGAVCLIAAPHNASIRSTIDPRNVRSISEASLSFFCKDYREANMLEHLGIDTDFNVEMGHILEPDWARKSADAQRDGLRTFWNVCTDIQFKLTKK